MLTDTKIKEIPMLFKDTMVAAIMSGTKTETRRLVFNDNDYPDGDEYSKAEIVYNPEIADPKADDIVPMTLKGPCIQFNDGEHIVKHNYGAEGDVIWVRESWRPCTRTDANIMSIEFRDGNFVSVLDEDALWFIDKTNIGTKFKWQPNMFLFRRYARTFLKRTFTKVERLQDITAEGAIAEGIDFIIPRKEAERMNSGLHLDSYDNEPYYKHYPDDKKGNQRFSFKNPIESYRSLWESINGKGSWGLNPWVIVIGFEKIDNYATK